MRPTPARTARHLLGLGIVLAIWETGSRSGLVSASYLPPPTVVTARMAQLLTDGGFLADAVSTLLSWAIALVCATAAGVGLGILVTGVAALRILVPPLVEFLRPLPTVALIPLAVVVLGTGSQIKITLAALAATWPTLLTTVHALHSIDSVQLDTARVYRTPRVHVLLALTLPAIAPALLTGIRLAASITVIVVVGTEFLTGGTIGLGQFAYVQGSLAGRMDLVLATTAIVTLLYCAVDGALLAVQRRTMPWAVRTEAP